MIDLDDWRVKGLVCNTRISRTNNRSQISAFRLYDGVAASRSICLPVSQLPIHNFHIQKAGKQAIDSSRQETKRAGLAAATTGEGGYWQKKREVYRILSLSKYEKEEGTT